MLFDIIIIICCIILFVYFIYLRFINTFIVRKRSKFGDDIIFLDCTKGIFYTKFKVYFNKSSLYVDSCSELLNNYLISSNSDIKILFSGPMISKVYIFIIPNRKIKNYEKF